jgi:MFS family permease
MFLFSGIGAHTSQLELALKMVVLGAGLGVTFPIFNLVVQSAFSQRQLGVVTASVQLSRTIGGSVGGALFGGLVNQKIASGLSLGTALSQSFFLAMFVAGAAFIIVLFLPEIHLRSSNHPVLEEAGVEAEEEFGVGEAIGL